MSDAGGPLGSLKGKPVVVFGLGRFGGGAGAARFLAERGARVLVTDLREAAELPEARKELAGLDLQWRLGEHRHQDLEGAELVVANPAVPAGSEWLRHARAGGARITTEIELFLAFAECPAIGITGTHGKTSTATFAVQWIEAAGRTALLGGNAGGSLLGRVGRFEQDDIAVLELSSYQLEHLGAPPLAARGLEAAAITCLGNDHLDRHGGSGGYAAAKRRIAELVRPGGDLWLGGDLEQDPEFSGLSGARAASSLDSAGERLPGAESLLGQLPGFQRQNAALALDLVGSLGIEIPRPGAPLRTPPHRLEALPPLAGLRVLDNAVSTTPESTATALQSLDGPVVLLLGGRSKGLPLNPLLQAAQGRVRAAVAFGEAASEFSLALREARISAVRAEDLGAAVALSVGLGRPGDTLLFSPAASSFDGYPNFRERAAAFRASLDALRKPAPFHLRSGDSGL